MKSCGMWVVLALFLSGCAHSIGAPKPAVDCSTNLAELQQWLDQHVDKELGRKIPIRKRDVALVGTAMAGDLVIIVGTSAGYLVASVASLAGDDDQKAAAMAAKSLSEKAMEKAASMPLENEAYAYVFNSRAFERDRFARRWRGLADCHFAAGDYAEAIRVYEDIVVNADALQIRPLAGMKTVYGNLAESYSNLGMPAEAEIYRARQAAEQ